MDFPQNVTFFWKCNSVRNCHNIQNEVLLERYIFAETVAYQFINLNRKLNGSKEEFIYTVPYGDENDSTGAKRVK